MKETLIHKLIWLWHSFSLDPLFKRVFHNKWNHMLQLCCLIRGSHTVLRNYRNHIMAQHNIQLLATCFTSRAARHLLFSFLCFVFSLYTPSCMNLPIIGYSSSSTAVDSFIVSLIRLPVTVLTVLILSLIDNTLIGALLW